MFDKFYFHPVGQGLFYTGSICNGSYNFVFDCGSATPKAGCLDKCIDQFVKSLNNKPIGFVCISHLDYDHIIGLIQLKKKQILKKYICHIFILII